MPRSIRTSRSTHALETGEAKLWILLVGVNQYEDGQLPSLQYSAIDCQGLAEALVEVTQAFPQKQVQIHHDFAAALPQLEVVRASLKQIVASAQPQDTVLIYFSGHGVLEPRKQQVFLCLADTQKRNLTDTGLAVTELLYLLGNCAARQQLIWLDACHSGGMTLIGRQAEIGRPGESISAQNTELLPNPTPQLVEVLQKRATQSQGFYALLSCDRSQQSWEFPELGHGVFTYYLMRGLRGEAANTQGVIEADGLYKYVYHQTLQYIDKTNQQLRLINQQKRGRGETQLQSEYPLQTPKRIVEGIGELVLGMSPATSESTHPRQALVVDGLANHPATLRFSRVLRSAGNFDLEYRPQAGKDWSEIRTTIQTCLQSFPSPTPYTPHPTPSSETTALLYLRGHLEETTEGESWLILGDGQRLSRSWLRQELRHSMMAQQIVVLDCPAATSLASWVEDLQLGADAATGTRLDRGQCLIAAASPTDQPDLLIQTLVQTLETATEPTGLPVAGWITRLQVALAGTGVTPHIWLSGARGVIEVLPERTGSHSTDADSFDLGVCPYMGLQAFTETDAQFFYGREALIQNLLQHLNQHVCLAVVGASGSGKSSVVQAGLMAQLRQEKQLPSSDRWWIGCFRPGEHPLKALAQRLVDAGDEPEKTDQQNQIEGLLYQGVEGFVHWLRQRSEPMVMLVVDQFEELFTLTSEQERQQFLSLILGAVEYAGDRFKLVFTLRADFITACLENADLATILQQSSVLVPPSLIEDDYRQVIIKPAEQVGLQVEPELVEVLLEELNHSAGDLPLLEFVLEQLWEHRQAGKLTLQTYQHELGGLKIALERKAQEVYDSLDPKAQTCAQWIFLTLTQLGDNTEDTRRRIHKSDLIVAKYPEPLVDRTLQALTAAKLIVVGVDEEKTDGEKQTAQGRGVKESDADRGTKQQKLNSELKTSSSLPSPTPNPHPLAPTPHSPLPTPTIEVAHEILIRHWSTLRWWLEENRARLRAQRQIAESALLWQQHDRQPDFLLKGVRLAAAEDLYIKYTDELPQYVQQFIEACLEERQREQQLAKRRLRRTQMVATVIGVLGLGATGLAGLASWQQRTAQLREIEALAASSEALLSSNQQLESLVSSVKAADRLQQLKTLMGIPVSVPLDTEVKTVGALQQVIARTQELNRLEGHTNKVNAVSFSPNGELVATASDDRTIKLWRKNGTWLTDLTGHSDRVTNLAFSPDGNLLATASADKTVKLWRSDGTLITTISGHQDWVTAVNFSPNGQVLATASRDRTIKLWSIPHSPLPTPHSPLQTLIGNRGWVNSISFSSNSQFIAAAGEDGTVRIWRVVDVQTVDAQNSSSPIGSFSAGNERITSVSFSPDSKTLATSSGDRTVKLWNWTGGLLQTFDGFGDQVNRVRFSPDGKSLAIASSNTITLWNLTGQLIQSFRGHGAEVNDISFSPDSRTLISASTDKTVRLWATDHPLQTYSTGTFAATFSPDGQTIAIGGWDKTIQLLSYSSPHPTSHTLPPLPHPITALRFSPNGKLLASASADKIVRLWSMPEGKLVRSLTGHTDNITAMSFSPDGKTLATGSADKTIHLWNVEAGSQMRSIVGHTDGVTAVMFSPDGKTLASGSHDKTIRYWSLDGTLIRTLAPHGSAVADVRFSPNGKILASASWDNTIKLWSRNNGSLMRTLAGHSDGVTSLDFSSNSLLVSGSADSTIKLWDTTTGTLLKTLVAPSEAGSNSIRSVQFNRDGTAIISASDAGAIVWSLNLDNLLQQGCDRLRDYLQRVEAQVGNEQRYCRRKT